MNCCNPIIATNAGGIPYIVSTSTTVGTESVNIALELRPTKPAGYLTVIINDVVPTATTATLPVTLSMGETTRPLTFANGTPVTAAALINVSNILVFNDRRRRLLTLMSRTIA